MAKETKTIRPSDASAIKRFAKKHFGAEYLEDMTDKQMQELLDAPNSVFGSMKLQGNVAAERARRKSLVKAAYKDEIMRDDKKERRNRNTRGLLQNILKSYREDEPESKKSAGGTRMGKKHIMELPTNSSTKRGK
jgi:hypothetical protein